MRLDRHPLDMRPIYPILKAGWKAWACCAARRAAFRSTQILSKASHTTVSRAMDPFCRGYRNSTLFIPQTSISLDGPSDRAGGWLSGSYT